jgi:dihydrofolate reductase
MNTHSYKPFITIIVAIAKNGVIGNKGDLPWHISEDLKRFKKITLKKPVLMGRKTYDSIVEKIGGALPERENLILTKQKEIESFDPNTLFFNNISQIFSWLKSKKHEHLYIAGGTSIYEKFLPIASRIEVTHIHKDFEGDTVFPSWDKKVWKTTKGELKKDTKTGLVFNYTTYDKF